jgi:hypothetical protein
MYGFLHGEDRGGWPSEIKNERAELIQQLKDSLTSYTQRMLKLEE